MENDKIILTGITTSGTPHLGNLVGAIRPAIESSSKDSRLWYGSGPSAAQNLGADSVIG